MIKNLSDNAGAIMGRVNISCFEGAKGSGKVRHLLLILAH